MNPGLTPLPMEARARAHGRFPYALTPRALLLLAAGLLLLAPAFAFHPFLFAAPIWDCAILALAVYDAAHIPAPSLIATARAWRGMAVLGRPVEIELTISSGKHLRGEALDALPPALVPDAPLWRAFSASASGPAMIAYTVIPSERGDAEAGEVFLRLRSFLGLAESWAVANLGQTVRVYPAMHENGGGALSLLRTRRIEAAMRKLRTRGQGRELESLREYREGGDELRDVAWTATARRGVLIAKQYQIERSRPVWLVVDAGRLLRARVGPHSKLDYTAATALAVGRMALLTGDRVGLLAYGREVRSLILPGRGLGQYRRLMDALACLPAESGEADHLLASAALGRSQPTRALVLWLTDFAETVRRPEVIDGAARLLSRHLLLFAVPREEGLRALAARSPADVEAMFARAAAQDMLFRRRLLLRRLRAEGALTLEASLDRLESEMLNRYLEIKERSLA